MRKVLLEAFHQANGGFVSGQNLAEIMGCSRTAVWKHIEELRKDGYEIEAIRKKGYRINKSPGKLSGNSILLGLETKMMGKHISYHESLPSTQKIAHKLADSGAEEGTLVIADEQTEGKGRLLRTWHSAKTGIWMSLVLRPKIPMHQAPQLTLLAAVAIVQAIEDTTSLLPAIKWPNDILINGKKVTGILTEMQAEADRIHSVIIGIGINVNQGLEDFPDEIKETATSLSIEEGQPISRTSIIQSFLKHFEILYNLFLKEGFKPIKLLWESYAVSLGKEIKASTLTGVLYGKAIGITEDGVLLLKDDEGEIHNIYSADIEIS
ncbi:BirA family biotin operon repressor/biotin-[acetyl-CoA-carboxylase] ligase [Peribacillus deserti]|uniref:Bifunctional ligase/repressor BirA n=1 Tax=Peribacillus deserti TaxID=673318 RepID=A0ABS2QI30_9BACI|nr:biotin--[acetyl-CoA-carboxylase] ligase [Peribacillus deserti]MBM7692620.1 BirA family biotin operon repressor/biotin-[acetyl-CoA-carboxylase] ligase [Peribacillus deserti]